MEKCWIGYNTGVKQWIYLSYTRLLLPLIVGFVFPMAAEPVWLAAARQPAETQAAEVSAASRLAALEPWRAEVHERLGIAFWKSGDSHEASDELQVARSQGELSLSGAITLAKTMTSLGDNRAAEAWLDVLQYPDLPEDVFQSMVNTLRKTGTIQQFTEASAAWQNAYPLSESARQVYAACLSVQQPDHATDLLQAGQPLPPRVKTLLSALNELAGTDDLAHGWLVVGQALSSLNEWKLAAEAFQFSINANPDYSEAWALLGEAREQTGQDGGSALQQAYALEPESTVTLGLLGLRERRQGNPGVALNYLHKAARLEPQKAIWQLELAAVYESLGNLPEAQGFLASAAQLEPGSSLVWQTIAAFSLRNRADVEQMGLAAARQAVALAPQDPLTNETMGHVMAYLEDYHTARRYFEQAIIYDPQNARLYYDLGTLFVHLKDFEAARESLVRAIQLDYDGQVQSAAQNILDQINGAAP